MDVTGPRTRQGLEDLIIFGNSFERQLPDGSWECISPADYLQQAPDDDGFAKELLALIKEVAAAYKNGRS